MKKVLAFIGVTIYGCIAARLLWYLFHIATPWLMSFGWIAVIIYYVFLFGLIPSVFGFAGTLLFMPISKLVSTCPASKYIPIWFLIADGFFSAREPWILDIDYELVKIIIAMSITLAAITTFASLIYHLHLMSKANE